MKSKREQAEEYFSKGSALGNLGRNEEALVAYDKAIEKNDTLNALHLCNRANCHIKLGNKKLAHEDFAEVKKLLEAGGSLGKNLSKGNVNAIKSTFAEYEKTTALVDKVTDNMLAQVSPKNQEVVRKAAKILKDNIENNTIANIANADKADKTQSQKSIVPTKDEILKAVAQDIQEQKELNIIQEEVDEGQDQKIKYLENKVLEMHQIIIAIEANQKIESDCCKIFNIDEVVYGKEILNHPELLKYLTENFGNLDSILAINDLVCPELIAEARDNDDMELLLAGFNSAVDGFDYA